MLGNGSNFKRHCDGAKYLLINLEMRTILEALFSRYVVVTNPDGTVIIVQNWNVRKLRMSHAAGQPRCCLQLL